MWSCVISAFNLKTDFNCLKELGNWDYKEITGVLSREIFIQIQLDQPYRLHDFEKLSSRCKPGMKLTKSFHSGAKHSESQ